MIDVEKQQTKTALDTSTNYTPSGWTSFVSSYKYCVFVVSIVDFVEKIIMYQMFSSWVGVLRFFATITFILL